MNVELGTIRESFPGTRNQVFLDAACMSLLPVQAEAAMRRLGEELLDCRRRDASAQHVALDATSEVPRREAARLIGANTSDVALVESTTQALQAVAATIPLIPGDEILIGETEFLGLAVPWIGRQPRERYEFVVVPHRQGRLLAEDFERAATPRARVILLSSVQWNNGYRADLAAFSDLARRRDLVLVVDAIQQLGAIALDVQRTPVDFLVCGGHKWLNAPVGRGFLYVHPRWHDADPPAFGYLSIVEPEQGWAEYFATPTIPAVREYAFHPSARRFEIGGTANYPGNAALGASLELVNQLGIDAIERHVLDLTDVLIDRLRSAGATIVTPGERSARSGIVTFTLGDGTARDAAALATLLDQRILISRRYTAGVGGLRVSVHFFNDRDDLERLAAAVARLS